MQKGETQFDTNEIVRYLLTPEFFNLTIYHMGVYNERVKKLFGTKFGMKSHGEENNMVEKKNTETEENKTGSAKGCCCCQSKTKHRTDKEYKDLINRLSRIEGQVRGVKGMVENDAYCPDILMQVSAITAALNSFNKVLLANHIKTCVVKDLHEGKDEVVDELVTTLQKLMK